MQALSIVPYYDVDRELHELKHRGELVPTRNEVMGKIGASILLSYSGLGFVRVLHSRVVVSSCSYIREIAKQSTRSQEPFVGSLLFYEKKTPLSRAMALSSY